MNRKKLVRAVLYTVLLLPLLSPPTGCSPVDRVEPVHEISCAAHPEFVVAEDGLAALEEFYGFHFDIVHELAVGLTHEALRAGDVHAALGYATDAKIKELDLLGLADDRRFFPACKAAPVVRSRVLQRYPAIESVFAEITPLLDNQTMIELNYLVDIEEMDPAMVARDWLDKRGLLNGGPEGPFPDRPVKIGAKDFTEQQILRQIALHALKDAGIPAKEAAAPPGTESVRYAMAGGFIDLYWEYIGFVWKDIYRREEKITDPDELFRLVAEKDEHLDLVWLDYAPLDNSYVLMMRREDAEHLEISNISDFADWVNSVQAARDR